ncbi:MAG TPA: V-type ATP synthase subunit E family protein [Nitrososphaeraceae archaeon]|nr:V-type ATP synthase subunit E family protein [Nitrososphaeraceae archaeon]
MTSLFTFMREIDERKQRKIDIIDTSFAEKKAAIEISKETTIKELKEFYANEAKVRSQRDAARIVETAKLDAKKVLFDAINENMDSTFNTIRQELKNYTKKPEYKKTLERMVNHAKKNLGKNVVIHSNVDDSMAIKAMNVTLGATIDTIGGILAEDNNGTREIDLTFEELLRTHEDDVKSFLLERMIK